MTTRAEELARQVEAAHNDLLAEVERSTDDQWSATCTDGEWTQGFAAYHAASVIGGIADTVKRIADGEPRVPMTSMDDIDAGNAAAAQEHAACTKAETVELIKAAVPAAVAMVRSRTDDQLERTVIMMVGMPEQSVAQLIENALVGHAARITCRRYAPHGDAAAANRSRARARPLVSTTRNASP